MKKIIYLSVLCFAILTPVFGFSQVQNMNEPKLNTEKVSNTPTSITQQKSTGKRIDLTKKDPSGVNDNVSPTNAREVNPAPTDNRKTVESTMQLAAPIDNKHQIAPVPNPPANK